MLSKFGNHWHKVQKTNKFFCLLWDLSSGLSQRIEGGKKIKKRKRKKLGKILNQCINLHLLFKANHLHTYSLLFLKLAQQNAEKKIIIEVHGILCWHEFLQHSPSPLRRMLIWVREQKRDYSHKHKKRYADSKVTTTAF